MQFKEWLIKEAGTTTGDIAGFRRITIPLVRRMWSPSIATMYAEDPPKKKKPYKVPQVEEANDLRQWYVHTDKKESAIELGLTPVQRSSQFPYVFMAQSREEAFLAAHLIRQEGGQVRVTAARA